MAKHLSMNKFTGHLRDQGDLRPGARCLRYPMAGREGAPCQDPEAPHERHHRRRPNPLLARHHRPQRRKGIKSSHLAF